LDNPRRIAPCALNIGIQAARGEVILRMDAHVIYLPSYLPILVHALLERGADNVGGVLETLPGADTAVARAIALGLAHRLGVGNSYFRVGASQPRWVDTVAFGCFRRAAFERAGLFDEELVRNQDDEFNFRLIRRGGRVLLMPTARAYYVARTSLRQLWRMYFQYGYFKPLVARKVGRVMTLRQLVPSLFLTTLAACGLAAPPPPPPPPSMRPSRRGASATPPLPRPGTRAGAAHSAQGVTQSQLSLDLAASQPPGRHYAAHVTRRHPSAHASLRTRGIRSGVLIRPDRVPAGGRAPQSVDVVRHDGETQPGADGGTPRLHVEVKSDGVRELRIGTVQVARERGAPRAAGAHRSTHRQIAAHGDVHEPRAVEPP